MGTPSKFCMGMRYSRQCIPSPTWSISWISPSWREEQSRFM